MGPPFYCYLRTRTSIKQAAIGGAWHSVLLSDCNFCAFFHPSGMLESTRKAQASYNPRTCQCISVPPKA